ncbi:MAG: uroporphyrinogen decarboxylase/cobalamine-independent methonine synthase family protein [Saccharofermentanales bacterium]
MNNRERTHAVLNYEKYDRLPIVHFGFWGELLYKWKEEGHISADELSRYSGDACPVEEDIIARLGFDFNWQNMVYSATSLHPAFETKTLEVCSDGSKKVMNSWGVIQLVNDSINSIPSDLDYTLKGRDEWEELYLPKLQFTPERVNMALLAQMKDDSNRENPVGLHCGSLYGEIRNLMGIEGLSYLYADDEDLYYEIIDTIGNLCYKCVETVLSTGVKFDFAHFWEDICFKNGPLVNPSVFNERVGSHYKKITELVNSHGIDIVSLDCDGFIDALIPTWINNGVNTMFPIEVGTWNANIAPWREKYGRNLRGVGGMNKNVFGRDYQAIDEEIERLKPLVELGGFIPCPDHRIPPDAKWENIQYYCDRMRKIYDFR